jgi:sporulation protein YlmC with PRC-barrel domain
VNVEKVNFNRSYIMNMKLGRKIVVAALCSVVLISSASAAEEKKETVVPPVPAGKVTLGVTVVETDLVATGWRASKLIGADVYNESSDKIGKIEDLILTPDGTLSVAIVDVGGFLGVGKHRVAIPVRQFTQIAPKAILPGATKGALKKLPTFVYAQ